MNPVTNSSEIFNYSLKKEEMRSKVYVSAEDKKINIQCNLWCEDFCKETKWEKELGQFLGKNWILETVLLTNYETPEKLFFRQNRVKFKLRCEDSNVLFKAICEFNRTEQNLEATDSGNEKIISFSIEDLLNDNQKNKKEFIVFNFSILPD